jgi:predicted permease
MRPVCVVRQHGYYRRIRVRVNYPEARGITSKPGNVMIESIRHDSRFALRQMKRSPGFTAVALVAVAVGIGANATVFSFFSAIQLSTLSVGGADRLVAVHRVDQRAAAGRQSLTAAEYDYYREHATGFTGLAAQNWTWTWLSHGERSVEWKGGQVSFNYFDVLGLTPHAGGFFNSDHDFQSVVLSYRAWLRVFDGDPRVVGQSVRLNQQPFTIVGVAPKEFAGVYLGDSLDVWVLHARPDGVGVGRLRPGRSFEEARAELSTLSARLAEHAVPEERHARVIVEPLKGVHPDTVRALAVFPSLLAAATVCLLAIACANLAGLLLARADSRRKEIALRLSLGASRGRVVRQLLTESILLSAIGGMLGLWLAAFGCDLVEQFFGYQIPDVRLALDWRVVSLALGLSVVTGIIFGLMPAWYATRTDLTAAMRERSYAGVSAIAVQIAVSAVLLICAGLLFQSMRAVLVRPGIDPERVAHFRLRPSRLGYSLERARAYQRELLRKVEAVPGVERAVLARVPPERGWCCEIDVAKPAEATIRVPQNEVSPGFLPALAIPILDGRDFVDGDRNVALVNQALAAQLWPRQRALDRELWVDRQPYRVIGIAGDIHAVQPAEHDYPYLYLPLWGRDARDPRLFVRVHGTAAPMLEQLRRVVVAVDPEVHVGQESTLAGRAEMSYQRERLLAAMLEFTSSVALLLSAIGIYGLVSYQVSRRTREIGIRMALGAQTNEVIGWIMRRGLIATCTGLAAGALVAWQAARMLSGFLYGIGPADPFTFAAALGVLAIVALAASFLPARLVSRIDPAVALRDQ